MSSTYSPDLRIQLMGPGDQAGTWGSTTNNNFQYIFEQAIAGLQVVSVTTTPQALTYLNGATPTLANNQAICAVLQLSNGGVGANFTLTTPSGAQKTYVVFNNTAYVATMQVTGSSGSTIAIPAGVTATVYTDGTNFYAGSTGTVGSFSVNGALSATGSVTASNHIGAGTGLTGTATSLSIGGNAATATTATTATTANALNTSNAYTGTTFTATTQFSGPGTGLTGTASSLTVGTATTATTASTANALNTSNTYGINGLYIYNGNGINFYASGNVNYITVAAASANSLYVGGGLQATGLLQGTQLADSLFRVTSGSSANAGSFGTVFIDFAPSGTFTLKFPDYPSNGQKFSVGTYSNTITFAASLGAGTSYIGGVPSTITPTTPAQWTYYSGTSAWFRSG